MPENFYDAEDERSASLYEVLDEHSAHTEVLASRIGQRVAQVDKWSGASNFVVAILGLILVASALLPGSLPSVAYVVALIVIVTLVISTAIWRLTTLSRLEQEGRQAARELRTLTAEIAAAHGG
ncbi:hypothetical protein SAMN05216488_0065 [Microbacterium sp. LKL04]|uniref:hypothetical protein n=1 Tax=Microbacterium sp. LKL04 TaxID=912630 RepID=UPI000875B1A8|nr:hypothetical protein [Microbacterium sp. LKL04]SCX94148.1 hypothetical protein SAMN05216488_0065 [Microbacterium sp. LKL04]